MSISKSTDITPTNFLKFLKSKGFVHKQYKDQVGCPVLYNKVYFSEEIPNFFNGMEFVQEEEGDIIEFEVSEDGQIFQYCSSSGMFEVFYTEENSDMIFEALEDLGLVE